MYNKSIKRNFTDRDLTMSYFATPSSLSTKNGDFSGRKYGKYWGLQLAVLKRLVVLKGQIFNIFLKLVYCVQEYIRYDGVFKT